MMRALFTLTISTMFEITKRFTFEASHQLPWHQGKCQRLHGHSYKLEVTLESQGLDHNGIVVDFDVLSEIVDKGVVKRFDHQHLNEFFENPTAEVIALEVYRIIAVTLRLNGQSTVRVSCVKLWETEKCSVTVSNLAV